MKDLVLLWTEIFLKMIGNSLILIKNILFLLKCNRPLNGKLEQSYMNFRSANPNWEGDSIGRAMEEKIQYYRIAKLVIYIYIYLLLNHYNIDI